MKIMEMLLVPVMLVVLTPNIITSASFNSSKFLLNRLYLKTFRLNTKLNARITSEAKKQGMDLVTEILKNIVEFPQQKKAAPGNANVYVDKMLIKLQEYLQENMEPLELEAMEDLKWARVNGLSSIHRSGDATIIHEGTSVVLKANLGFKDLKATGYLEKQLWWVFWISGTGHISVKGMNIYGQLRISLRDNINPQLEELTVTDWGQIEASIDGDNWIGEIVEFFTNLFPSLIINYLKSNLPSLIKDSISNILNGIDFNFGKFYGNKYV